MEGPRPGSQVTPVIRLKSRLRSGGMGSVWLAHHDKLATEVVVKFLCQALCEDTTSRARFLQEAAAAAQVRSPHVVQMLDHGVMDDGTPFLVMEYLEGYDLGQLLMDGPLAPDEVAQVVEHVARALDAAHRRGVVHRDVKPGNIFLTHVGAREPFVKLLDFGVAKAASLQNLTMTGELIGTPVYMSPEQIDGRPVDHRSDLWSLGVVAFRALTGERPFNGDTVSAMAYQVVHTTPPRPSELRADLPPEIDSWFQRACARDPDERFATARDMADELWRAVGQPEAASSSGAWPAPKRQGAAVSAPAPVKANPTGTTVPASGSGSGVAPPGSAPGSSDANTWPTPPSTAARTVPVVSGIGGGGPPAGYAPAVEPTGGSLQSSVSTLGSQPDAQRRRRTVGLLLALGVGLLVALVAVLGSLTGETTEALEPSSDEPSSAPAHGPAEPADEQAEPSGPTSAPEPDDSSAPAASTAPDPSTSAAPRPGKTTPPRYPVRPRPSAKSGDGDLEDLGF